MERAILSLSFENIFTIWLMVGLLYLASVIGYQVWMRLMGAGNGTVAQPGNASIQSGGLTGGGGY